MNARRTFRVLVYASAVVIAVNAVLAGLPASGAARAAFPFVVAAGIALWLAGTYSKLTNPWILAFCFTGAGLCGALMDLLLPSGPGYILSFMAVAGIGLRLSRTPAFVFGGLVVVGTALAEAFNSSQGVSAFLNLAIGGFFLFLASAFAQANRMAREEAEERLAQESATRAAREEAARLAERGRIARELHDVLAHTLAGLAVQLEGARLLATKTNADPRLVDQLAGAHGMARDGLGSARQVVEMLRGDRLPGPSLIPGLVAQHPGATLTVTGTPRPLPPEDGLALYRTVQEALTNAAKHAGPSALVTVAVNWRPDAVEVGVTDDGGPGAALPSGGFGLTGLAERAALAGGHLSAGPTDTGWRVSLTMPLGEK
ncbi:sensor histidine kinase [Paractinoplanes atraurantiacus]|uniref:histidine kinase n=1 Tax=Paractinoplanes atraurantiacus TaxID=1036182 RepID=A0A285JV80_9ACTN|nr:histidine kinase [Actinoplanes atraurantiacus]SNY62981.1 Signal transduction histidine kinase [Actinoplanes atraurantiacus]